jgi:hypothetical protein
MRPAAGNAGNGGDAMRRAFLALGLMAMGALVFAAPAAATVHEITGMFCAGEENGNPFPPGLSGGSNADNFAKPLAATGFIESVVPYDDGVNGPGMLISFNFDHPASKISPHPTIEILFVGDGTYITWFELDSSHGFTNCVRIRAS